MTKEALAHERMTDRYVVLHRKSLRELERELSGSGMEIAIIVDDESRPLWILGAKGPSMLWQTDSDTPLRILITNADLVEQLLAGAPGVLVVEDGRPVGILPTQALVSYLVDEASVRGPVQGDHMLFGDVQVGMSHLICMRCGTVNSPPTYVSGSTKCVNGHLLEVDLGDE